MESQIIIKEHRHTEINLLLPRIKQDPHRTQSSGLPSFSPSPVTGLPLQRKCAMRILTTTVRFPSAEQANHSNTFSIKVFRARARRGLSMHNNSSSRFQSRVVCANLLFAINLQSLLFGIFKSIYASRPGIDLKTKEND